MNTPDKVIEIALNEVGYLEKKNGDVNYIYDKTANAGDKNYTKYGLEMHQIYPSVMDYPAYWCFTKDTLILTDKGYKQIDEIVIGDKVLNAYGNSFNTVINVSSRISNINEIRAYGTLRLLTTPDHPFLSNKRLGVRKDWKYSELTFNPINELKHGDNVVIPLISIKKPINITYNQAWLIGYFVGDGWKAINNNQYKICGDDDKEVEIYKHIEKVDYLHKDKYYKSRSCNEYTLNKNVYSDILPILDQAGQGAINKQVPIDIIFSNMDIKKAFLDGYLWADGTKEGHFNTVSKKLILGLSKIIFDLGYGCSVIEIHRKETERTIFDKRINNYRKFNMQPIIYNGHINKNINKEYTMHRIHENLIYVPIKYNNPLDIKETVFNISTDGDHTYLANNLAVHNCDCFCDWCFQKAYGVSTAKSLIGGDFNDYTVASCQMYQKMNALDHTPRIGDQVFFTKNGQVSGCHHTGIVYDVDNTYFYTVEGNTSNTSGVVRNGGGVAKKKYNIFSYKAKTLFGHPKYDIKVEKKNYSDKFVDVSAYNANIDYPTMVKSGIGGAVIKFIRKDLQPDQLFTIHFNGFRAAGMTNLSFYTYIYANTLANAKRDAERGVQILKDKKGYTVWIDAEDSSLTQLKTTLIDIINTEYDIYTAAGFNVGLYTGLSFWKSYIAPYKDKLKPTMLWIARYYKGETQMPLDEDPNENYKPLPDITAWQYTSKGIVPGYNGNIDISKVYTQSSSSKYKKGVVIANSLNIRNKPNTDGQIVGKLVLNTPVVIYEEDKQSGWYKISKDSEQWISNKYLTLPHA